MLTINFSNLAVLEFMFSRDIVMPTFDLQNMTNLMFNSSYIGSSRLLKGARLVDAAAEVHSLVPVKVSATTQHVSLKQQNIGINVNF